MKIELRKIHHSPSLSEETNAYTADLYVDGKLLAHVSNQGHGGCDMQRPAKGKTQADLDAVEVWIKANIPAKKTGMILPDESEFVMEPDLEGVCGDLLTDHLVERDLKRLLNRTVAFVVDGTKGVRSYTGKKSPEQKNELIVHTRQNYPTAKILNALPLAEAMAVYKAA